MGGRFPLEYMAGFTSEWVAGFARNPQMGKSAVRLLAERT
jgi:hypothetical protein